jgi:predicted AlkP superfamily pyrophosphatase or phosphodiesterase
MHMSHTLRAIVLIVVFGVLAAAEAGPQPASPILVLISCDGCRWDALDRAPMPTLRALAARGVRAEALVPSFPTQTFPNHYTLVTGLYPGHHGIVGNNMFPDPTIGPDRFSMSSQTAKDGRWWGGEPLWVTAIRQGRRASAMFWPGTEAPIQGVRPTAFRAFDDAVANSARVQQVLDWLGAPEAERPDVAFLYFSDVDHAGHDYGPDAPETTAALGRVDAAIARLVSGIAALGLADRVTYVVVSDHGMAATSDERVVYLDDYIDLSQISVADWGAFVQIAPRGVGVDDVYRAIAGKHASMSAYRADDTPERWHYRGHPRIAPIVAVAAEGWTITTHTRQRALQLARVVAATGRGAHGYDPSAPSMHGLFVAAGPSLTRGTVVPPIENVHVYAFLCRVLGIAPAPNDGSSAVSSSWFVERTALSGRK